MANFRILLFAVLAGAIFAVPAHAGEQVLKFLNWSDYIDLEVLQNFEDQTGIPVRYNTAVSEEALDAAIRDHNSEYDLVCINLTSLAELRAADLLLPLDKTKLPQMSNLDAGRMAAIARYDTGNTYGIPYAEVYTGIAFNRRRVEAALGSDADLSSWQTVFDPANAARLKQCGLGFIDSPTDIYGSTLIYLGRDPLNPTAEDIAAATSLLRRIMPSTSETSNDFYDYDLAEGNLCAVIGWSGDLIRATQYAEREGHEPIEFIIPREGVVNGVDILVIPRHAAHPEAAHRFLDYMMKPAVSARITRFTNYAMANRLADEQLEAVMKDNIAIHVAPEQASRFHTMIPTPEFNHLMQENWNELYQQIGPRHNP